MNRNKCGRFKKQANSHSKCLISSKHIITDHNYVGNHVCPGRLVDIPVLLRVALIIATSMVWTGMDGVTAAV